MPVPEISLGSPPFLNSEFSIDLSNAPPNSAAVLVLGFSNQLFSGIPLPFDLGLIGFPSCMLNVSVDIPVTLMSDAAGEASFSFVPRNSFVIPVFWQWLVLNPAGPLPLHMSEGQTSLLRF